MGVNSLLKTVIRQRCDCDLNPCPSAPESSMLTTRLLSHAANIKILKCLPWHRNMESQWTLSMRYFTTINHVADNNFVFQQHIALVHYARNTVKLLERELSTSLFTSINYGPPLSISGANSTDIIFRDSLIGISISHRSTRLKKSSSDWLNLVKQATAYKWKDAILCLKCFTSWKTCMSILLPRRHWAKFCASNGAMAPVPLHCSALPKTTKSDGVH